MIANKIFFMNFKREGFIADLIWNRIYSMLWLFHLWKHHMDYNERIMKKLDYNYTRMLIVIWNKPWNQHPSKSATVRSPTSHLKNHISKMNKTGKYSSNILTVIENWRILSPVDWWCRIHRLHLCRLSPSECPSFDIEPSDGDLQPWSFGNIGYTLFVIAPRSTLTRSGSTWWGLIHRSNRSFWHLTWVQTNDISNGILRNRTLWPFNCL